MSGYDAAARGGAPMAAGMLPGIAPGIAPGNESSHSAISWAAIIAGAFAGAATMFVLVTLAAGFGLSSISPYANSGVSAATFTVGSAIGLIVVQWLSSGLGGFIAGRLRTKWVGVHTHEVFFRDTAHGFVTWAVATVVGMLLLASTVSSVVGGGTRAVASIAGGAAQGGGQVAAQLASNVSGYDVDTLFRSDRPDAVSNTQEAAAQATRILANGVSNGDVPPGDRTYLAQLISSRTGLSQADAQKRVDEAIERVKQAAAKARQAADAARRTAAQVSIFTALSLLVGAFIACAAAAIGGSFRDDH